MIKELIAVDTSFLIWGYAFTGDVLEFGARIAETRPGEYELDRAWDRRGKQVGELYHGNERLEIPDWWSLPWLAEHVTRGHAEYEVPWDG